MVFKEISVKKVMIFKKKNCAPCQALTDSIDSYTGKDLDDVDLFYADMSKPDDETVELSVKYNVRSAPTTVIVDEKGTVIYSGTMVRTVEDLINKMK